MTGISYTDLVAGVAVAAIALAAGATGLAFTARRYAARALTTAHTHPGDRRQRDTGPPPGQPERRAGTHRAPDDHGRARRRDTDDPRWRLTTDHPVTTDEAAQIRARLRASQLPEPGTDQLTPPTRAMPAIPRPPETNQ